MRFHLPMLLIAAAACGKAGGERATVAAGDSVPLRTAAADTGARECPAAPGEVALKVSARGPEFRFHTFGNADGEVDSITVSRGCVRTQTLRPGENYHTSSDASTRLSLKDLDFDGYGDLGFLDVAGSSNFAYEYWRYDPATGRFTPLGGYDELEVDSTRRVLTNRNTCCGGMQWVLGTYRVENGKMVTLREEMMSSADSTPLPDRYVHSIRERRGDSLAVVRSDTLSEAEAKRVTFGADEP
jgi:hypothetical protein